jgi:GMP synthase (glutamine-hydrolysing)
LPRPDVLVFRHARHEHLGAIAGSLRRRGLSFKYLDVWKKGVRFPAPGSFRAVVLMGGAMGVYEQDRYPFLAQEIRFLKAFFKLDRPVLGVCLGSQLIAAALGARVFPNKHKEIGWYPLILTPAGRKDPLLSSFPKSGHAFQWHGDTFTRPRGTAHLARSPLCRHQAVRYKEGVYGLQFHLEVTGPMIREWLAQPGAARELAAVGPSAERRLREGLPRRLPPMERAGRAFFDAWARLIDPPAGI